VEVARGRVLALTGSRLTGPDATLLRVFLSQLRLARERTELQALLHAREEAQRRAAT
jgi:hypothetical protein